jgi:hypothetical protein
MGSPSPCPRSCSLALSTCSAFGLVHEMYARTLAHNLNGGVLRRLGAVLACHQAKAVRGLHLGSGMAMKLCSTRLGYLWIEAARSGPLRAKDLRIKLADEEASRVHKESQSVSLRSFSPRASRDVFVPVEQRLAEYGKPYDWLSGVRKLTNGGHQPTVDTKYNECS